MTVLPQIFAVFLIYYCRRTAFTHTALSVHKCRMHQ